MSPRGDVELLPRQDPGESPAEAWRQPDFNDSQWEQGAGGFGFGDDDDVTVLTDMQGGYVSVYIRKEFSVSAVNAAAAVELVIDYDDGFIAYLNGREVARRYMPDGRCHVCDARLFLARSGNAGDYFPGHGRRFAP